MKIIQIDNFSRDHVSDRLICENVDEYHGTIMIDALNAKLGGEQSAAFFRLVEDDHKLYEFEP